MGTYDGFSEVSKVLLALSMWLGRLEIVTVLALLHPHVWRNLRWRAREGDPLFARTTEDR
jgi:Trk-type K+ transport system membrane component